MYEMWCWIVVLQFLLAEEVRVPKHTIKGHSVRLECHYDMEGEALYSVKWYKDGREFYRYVPRDDPPGTVFPQPGIIVDNSTSEQVVLDPIDFSSSGRYRCEVSAEAPSFQTVSDHGVMLVVVLPEEDPYITGGKPRYQIGDIVRVNCTSGRSKPAVHLTWNINGEPADASLVKRFEPIVSGPDKLETSILGLEFRVKAKHFKRGDMKLKCLATISTVYWKSNEESVEGEKIQKAPMLESRRAVPSDTRADRVQGKYTKHRCDGSLWRKFRAVFHRRTQAWPESYPHELNPSGGALTNKYSSGLNFTLRWLLTVLAASRLCWPSSSPSLP
uniref:Ig-like domain-containing protein n=1 Tax=Anopheles epiroticus TaxID=199890 RepID=A0A182PJ75_9DIPT